MKTVRLPGYIRFRLAGCQTNIPFITPYLCAGHHQRVLHRYLVPEGEDPVGQPISKYVPEKSEKGTIIGVMKDFKKYSLTNNVFPLRMILHEMPQDNYTTLTLQFESKIAQQLSIIFADYGKKNTPVLHSL